MQLSYTQHPDAFHEGSPADTGPSDDMSCVVDEANGIEPGLVVFRTDATVAPGQATPVRLPPALPAADPDSIIEAHATVAGATTFSGADLNGVIGGALISPARKLTLTVGSHGDIAAGNWILTYEDRFGVERADTFTTTENTGVTGTTAHAARRAISLLQPAMDGTGGSFTVGTSATVELGTEVLGVAVRTHKGRPSGVAANNELYENEERILVRKAGRIAVACENAFRPGDRAFVRVIAGGSERRGAIRVATTDSGDCVEWSRAHFVTGGSAGEIGILEVERS